MFLLIDWLIYWLTKLYPLRQFHGNSHTCPFVHLHQRLPTEFNEVPNSHKDDLQVTGWLVLEYLIYCNLFLYKYNATSTHIQQTKCNLPEATNWIAVISYYLIQMFISLSDYLACWKSIGLSCTMRKKVILTKGSWLSIHTCQVRREYVLSAPMAESQPCWYRAVLHSYRFRLLIQVVSCFGLLCFTPAFTMNVFSQRFRSLPLLVQNRYSTHHFMRAAHKASGPKLKQH